MKTPVTVDGMQIHVEEQGAGKPLVLLHGGIMASEVFGPNIGALAEHRRVIAIHLQGHGHTPDVDRPLRFETLADDVAAVIRELDLGKADLLGYFRSAAGSRCRRRSGIRTSSTGWPSCRGRRITTCWRRRKSHGWPGTFWTRRVGHLKPGA